MIRVSPIGHALSGDTNVDTFTGVRSVLAGTYWYLRGQAWNNICSANSASVSTDASSITHSYVDPPPEFRGVGFWGAQHPPNPKSTNFTHEPWRREKNRTQIILILLVFSTRPLYPQAVAPQKKCTNSTMWYRRY